MNVPSEIALTGRRVLITGAAGGIGSATATLCAELGAEVVLTDIKDCGPQVQRLIDQGAKAQAFACDVRDRTAIEALAQEVGDVDAMVLNAGAIAYDSWDDPDWDETFQQIIDVNLRAPMHFARCFLPEMRTRGNARIVLVGSIAGWTGGTLTNTGSHYVASKGGIHAFTRWLARRSAPDVAVNAVAPSATATPMIAGQTSGGGQQLVPRVAEAREVAWPIAFLCSAASSFVCGAILDVNGGAFLR